MIRHNDEIDEHTPLKTFIIVPVKDIEESQNDLVSSRQGTRIDQWWLHQCFGLTLAPRCASLCLIMAFLNGSNHSLSGPLPAARSLKFSFFAFSSGVAVFNVMSVNAPPPCWPSGRFDWAQLCWRKMGDDLGDEWWTHEGDQGTVIASIAYPFGIARTAIASGQLHLCSGRELRGNEMPWFVYDMLTVS